MAWPDREAVGPASFRGDTVRRSVAQFASALGVLVALAAFDLGPRACAAYQSVAVNTAAADDLGMSANDVPTLPRDLTPKNQKRVTQVDALYLPGSGGMTSPTSSSSPDGPPGAGCLPPSDPPADGLVVYFREPAGKLDLSAFVSTILDPPRVA